MKFSSHLAILSLFFFPFYTFAQVDTIRSYIKAPIGTLRAEPSTDSPKLEAIPQYEKVWVIGTPDHGYAKILYKDYVGYIRSDEISLPKEKKRTETQIRAPRESDRRYFTGPRGGCYYINSKGNKVYVERWKCK